MKTSEIANRCFEATNLATIADLLLGKFDYTDCDELVKMSERLEQIVDEIAKPIKDKIKEEKGDEQ